MSKFRARQLDATKPIAIYFQEDISDCTEFNNVTNRTVPQLPTGMEKEEETEHHLQQAIFHQRVIPVPEVFSCDAENGRITFNQLYPANYKLSRQMVHIHPFSADQDIPDYDMDSEDEKWLDEHTKKGELLPIDASQFEEMMDCLEKASGLKAVTLQEAKLLLKDDDDLITAVFDYWLNKRLRLQHPLIPQVRSDKIINSTASDPYIAFRKRTEKMQTRKNRKNDEASYEKMLKLRRDLMRAINLLEMIKKREKLKRESLQLNIEVHEKRYEMDDFSGSIINEINAERLSQQISRAVFSPIHSNHHHNSIQDSDFGSDLSTSGLWLKVPSSTSRSNKDDIKRERRPYRKKRKHLQHHPNSSSRGISNSSISHSYTHPPDPFSIASLYSQANLSGVGTCDEDDLASLSETEDDLAIDGVYGFRRKSYVNYHTPREPSEKEESPPFCRRPRSPNKHYYLTSLSHPTERVIGLARRRVGRGGRIWLDRIRQPLLDPRLKMETKDFVPGPSLADLDVSCPEEIAENLSYKWPHFYPKLPAIPGIDVDDTGEESDDVDIDVETVPPSPVAPTVGEGGLLPSSSSNRSVGTGNDDYASLLNSGPTSFYITAEILEGSECGSFTDLSVSLPLPCPSPSIVGDPDDNNDNLLEGGYGTGVSNAAHRDFIPFLQNASREGVMDCGERGNGKVAPSSLTHKKGFACTSNNNNSTNSDNFNVRSSSPSYGFQHPPPPYSSAVERSSDSRVDCDTSLFKSSSSSVVTGGSRPDLTSSFLPQTSPAPLSSTQPNVSSYQTSQLEHHHRVFHRSNQNLSSNFQTQPSSRFCTKDSTLLPNSSCITKSCPVVSSGGAFAGFSRSHSGSNTQHNLPSRTSSASSTISSRWGVDSSHSFTCTTISPSSCSISNSSLTCSTSTFPTYSCSNIYVLNNSICGDGVSSNTSISSSSTTTPVSTSSLLNAILPPSSHAKVNVDDLSGNISNYRSRLSNKLVSSSNVTLQSDSTFTPFSSSSSTKCNTGGSSIAPSTSVSNLPSNYRSSTEFLASKEQDRLQLSSSIPSDFFNSSTRNSGGTFVVNSNNNSSTAGAGGGLVVSSNNLVSRKIVSWTTDNLVNDVTTKDVISNGPSSKSLDSFNVTKCATKITNNPPALFPET